MDNKKQEAYMEVRNELLQKKDVIIGIHNKVSDGHPLSPQVVGILDGIGYALIIVDNLILQDRKS